MSEKFEHLYVVVEHEEGRAIPVSYEMLGEARRIMDGFNKKYSSDEKVVAVVLGSGMREFCDELASYGADVVIYADADQLTHAQNLVDTKVIAQIAKSKQLTLQYSPLSTDFERPRYMFFAADSIGRHLSSTVLAELDSGLASDINKLVVEDLDIKHEHKTKGQTMKYEKTLEMYRPDFSGFLWTTILCLDNRNPAIAREFHPQACSIIPGVFSPMTRDNTRLGKVIDFHPQLEQDDLRVRTISRTIVQSAVDFDSHKVIIGFGRGIKDAPEQNITLIESLAKEINAEIGVSLPISKKPYSVSEKHSLKYMIPDRVIGTSGRRVSPALYIAVGISGAVQHIVGMKESGFVIAINPDEEAPIKDECDIFIKGNMEDVLPLLIDRLKSIRPAIEVSK